MRNLPDETFDRYVEHQVAVALQLLVRFYPAWITIVRWRLLCCTAATAERADRSLHYFAGPTTKPASLRWW